MSNIQDLNYCVYFHRRTTDNIVFYIGSGVTNKRPKNFSGRSAEWNNNKSNYDVTVEIVRDGLSKTSARLLEKELIESGKYHDLINTSTVTEKYNSFSLSDIKDYLYYDTTSPTCLKWKISTGPRCAVGEQAGSFRFSKNKTKRGGSVRICGKSREISRIVWVLHNGHIQDDYVIDHYNGNSHDNRIENLRCITIAENCRNKNRNITSTNSIVGVYETNTRYSSSVSFGDIRKSASFSKSKYGSDVALQMAINWRHSALIELNKIGANYTDKHFSNLNSTVDSNHSPNGYLGISGLSIKKTNNGDIKCIIALYKTNGFRKEKSFSVRKYTLDKAILLAKEFLASKDKLI